MRNPCKAILLFVALTLTGIAPSWAQIPDWQANQQVVDSQCSPALATAPNGDLVMVWDSRGVDGDGRAVVMRRFAADGTALDAMEQQVNAFTASRQENAHLAIDGSGEIVVVWEGRSAADGSGVVARRFGADGSALSDEIQVNTTIPDNQVNPRVARATDGSFAVAWQDRGLNRIMMRRFAADGTPFGDPIDVNGVDLSSVREPDLAFDPDGELLVVWNDGGVFVQRYDVGGAPVGSALGLSEANTGLTPKIVVALDGSYLVAWRTNSGTERVFGQRVATDDSLLGSNVVFDTLELPIVAEIAAAAESDGGFRVVWSAGSNDPGVTLDLFSRRLDPAGQLVGAVETPATTSTDFNQIHPSLTPLVAGGSVLVWETPDQDAQGIFTDMPTTEPLFVDDFESGDTSRWYLAMP